MCGFNGVVSKVPFDNHKKLLEAKRFISRRGPDAFGFVEYQTFDNYFHLQHARLSIIDISDSSNQPFRKDGVVLVYNGEIYNFAEIRNSLLSKSVNFITDSDTEVIIEAYKAWGIKCVTKFVGMFAFALHDLELNKLFLMRDRTGIKPIYYSISETKIVFSSDLYSTKFLTERSFDLNVDAVGDFMLYGYLKQNQSYLMGLNKIEAGTFIEIDLRGYEYQVKTYWNPIEQYLDAEFSNQSDVINDLEPLLESSVHYRTVSDVPVGVFLSGGYDSSLVAAILKKKFRYDVNSFTIGFEDAKFDESNYAKQVADYLGLNHHSYICSHKETLDMVERLADVYDEPFGDSSAIPTLLVSKYASEHVKVVLSADGGDEVFGGYPKYTNSIKLYNQIKFLPDIFKQSFDLIPNKFLKNGYNYLLNTNLSEEHFVKLKRVIKSNSLLDVMSALGENPRQKLVKGYDRSSQMYNSLEGLNSLLYEDYKFYLESDILKKVDRATMYFSIEGREPLLDHRLFEFMAKVPPEYKIRNRMSKALIKQITHKYIPREIMDRPKMGFGIPISKMIYKDKSLSELFFDTISDDSIRKHSFLNLIEFQKLKKAYSKDYNDAFISLWYLFNYIRWFEKIEKI